MNPPVKPRATVSAVLLSLVLPVAPPAVAAPSREAKVVLWKNTSLPSGTLVREIREIHAGGGSLTYEGGKDLPSQSARYSHRVNLVRRLAGGEREQISVRDCARECAFYAGTAPPPVTEAAGPLQALDLRTRRVAGRIVYDLEKGTPTEAQRFALAELGQLSDLINVLALCTSPQPRAKGESWKVDLPRLTGKTAGYVVPEILECRLDDVTDGDGGQQAHIGVTGKLKLERPMGLNGVVTVAFSGTIARRLSDMLDVDATVTGTFTCRSPVVANGQPVTMNLEVPFTLHRTQKIEAR